MPYSSDAPTPVTDEALDDLRVRLDRYRETSVAPAPGWTRGIPTDYMAELVDHWKTGYDWRAHEDRIRS